VTASGSGYVAAPSGINLDPEPDATEPKSGRPRLAERVVEIVAVRGELDLRERLLGCAVAKSTSRTTDDPKCRQHSGHDERRKNPG